MLSELDDYIINHLTLEAEDDDGRPMMANISQAAELGRIDGFIPYQRPGQRGVTAYARRFLLSVGQENPVFDLLPIEPFQSRPGYEHLENRRLEFYAVIERQRKGVWTYRAWPIALFKATFVEVEDNAPRTTLRRKEPDDG